MVTHKLQDICHYIHSVKSRKH